MRLIGKRQNGTQTIISYRVDRVIDRRSAAVAMNCMARTKNLYPERFVVSMVNRDASWSGSYTVQFSPEQTGNFAAQIFKNDAESAFFEFLYRRHKYAFGFVFSDREARLVHPAAAPIEDVSAVQTVLETICRKKVEG